jgi:DNA-binding PadR family transcriptional regulator
MALYKFVCGAVAVLRWGMGTTNLYRGAAAQRVPVVQLLVLGALRQVGSLHAYGIEHELHRLGVHRSAHVLYGSIRFALEQLVRAELVVVVSPGAPGEPRARRTYAITAQGHKRFLAALRHYLGEVEPTIDPFRAALAFAEALSKEERVAVLQRRLEALHAARQRLEDELAETTSRAGVPAGAQEAMRLTAAHVDAEHGWIEAALAAQAASVG